MLSVAGCAALQNDLVYSIADDGSTVSIAIGETFLVRLDSNASTGYQWAHREVDDGVLENTDRDYLADSLLLVGSGGVEVWEFTARQAGTTDLLLEYVAPGDGAVEQSFELAVTVMDAP